MPSLEDRNNSTVAGDAAAKDTTANLFSMMVFAGEVTPEMLISPAETNSRIRAYVEYEYDSPRGAANPVQALWDPKFSADFTSREGGHTSYAHLLLHGKRMAKWNNSFQATDAVLGNRGPEVSGVSYGPGGVATPALADPRSNTLRIHGHPRRWEGNIVLNDNHVEYVTTGKAGTFEMGDGTEREDLLFYDEPEDAAGLNHFLGIFIKAGPAQGDFRAIWD